ncbi:hypothetical protein Bpfe_008745 [Biomphalaria pfeifferi]|uniref:Uncharacterized protein n=1 Tax=Biomphalaria pfeifferi TaxID=112525 RepID=A0AAD8BXW0_BIOPF|nr:hypothetical protein Bpfe_008745 [Biomphalaria pfeifferi]
MVGDGFETKNQFSFAPKNEPGINENYLSQSSSVLDCFSSLFTCTIMDIVIEYINAYALKKSEAKHPIEEKVKISKLETCNQAGIANKASTTRYQRTEPQQPDIKGQPYQPDIKEIAFSTVYQGTEPYQPDIKEQSLSKQISKYRASATRYQRTEPYQPDIKEQSPSNHK